MPHIFHEEPSARPVRTSLLVMLGCVVFLAGFIKWGRPIWKPIHIKLSGKRTISDIKKRYTKQVRAHYKRMRKRLLHQRTKAAIKRHEARHKRKLGARQKRQIAIEQGARLPSWRQLIDGQHITLLAFKQERRLELWKHIAGQPRFVKSYRFTGFSGGMGPKRKSGDGQIPEGIYKISYLNPNSSYHLSMKVSYPNRFDKAMGRRDKRRRLGGDIFIHGKNVTIGCIPIGDKAIEELFTIIAHNGYGKTKVIIAPHDLRKKPTPPTLQGISWAPTLYNKLTRALKPYKEH